MRDFLCLEVKDTMFPRHQRLTNPKLFALMTKSGTWNKGRFLSIRTLPARTGAGQITIVMSKKTAKQATERNRSKRRVRGVLQQFFKQDFVELTRQFHMLVVVHRSLVKVEAGELASDIEQILTQLARKTRG